MFCNQQAHLFFPTGISTTIGRLIHQHIMILINLDHARQGNCKHEITNHLTR